MNSRTATTMLDAPPRDVFDYLAEIENLPDWATEFARELRLVDGRHKVVKRPRRVLLRAASRRGDRRHRHARRAAEGRLAVFPTRVVGLPDGSSAFTFTMFQPPGMPDELFEAQYASLLRELENVQRRFASGG